MTESGSPRRRQGFRKVFASHYHYTWFEDSPSADFKGVANWGNTGDTDIAGNGGTYDIDTSFPKGATFGQWLGAVGATASAGPPPTIDLTIVADSVKTVNAPTSRWIYDPNGNDVKYLSFETPIGGAPPPADAGPGSGKQYCGKAVFTDLHTGGSLFATAASVPADCKTLRGWTSASMVAFKTALWVGEKKRDCSGLRSYRGAQRSKCARSRSTSTTSILRASLSQVKA